MGLQARVVDRTTHREVVEYLKAVALETEDVMAQVIEKAANVRAANLGCLCLEVLYLTSDPCFPIEPAVKRGVERLERLAILGEHCDGKRAVGGNRLIATRLLGKIADVSLHKKKERQRVRTSIGCVPQEASLH
jgi:hypothetical protein